ncbi:MAG TPA: retroviral-like aspartic protease family protein [Allosphingosinicella sp.]|jgi:predicted aspartyl protease
MPHPFLSIGAALALALCAGGSALSQTAPTPQAEASKDIVDFAATAADRMTVPVRIAGKGPYRFVVDTGAERTVVSNELVRQLGLGPGRSVRLHSMTGVGEFGTAMIPTLELSRQKVTDIHAPVLRETNIGAAGILGVDTLQSQRIDFDFEAQTMSITQAKASAVYSGPDTIVVTARRRLGRLILVDASLVGEKVTVILDTGSDATVGNEALRRKLVAKGRLERTIPIQLLSVTGGRISIDYTQVDDMRLGNVVIDRMPIGFADVHPFAQLGLGDRPAILLGMDALRLFSRVSVDFSRRKVHFLVPQNARRRGTTLAGGAGSGLNFR